MNNGFLFFCIFIILVILVNSCRVRIEKTISTTDLKPRKVVLEEHEYWISGTNITHSASCPCFKEN